MAAIHLPRTGHLPIVTILDFPLPWSTKQPGCNLHEADWPTICEKLDEQLKAHLLATRIRTAEEFDKRILLFTRVLMEVLDNEIPTMKPNHFARRWWTKELLQLKRKQNKLSNKSYKFRCIRDHPSHAEYREAVKQFCSLLDFTCNQHWNDWLESVAQQDVYVANKYITN